MSTSRTMALGLLQGTVINSLNPETLRRVMEPANHTYLTRSCRKAGISYRQAFNHTLRLGSNMNEQSNNNFGNFHGFSDGLLQSLRLEYRVDGRRDMTIVLSGRDWSDPDGKWRVATLKLTGVLEYRLVEPERTTAQVLSNGIHVLRSDASVGVDLGGLVDPPSNVDELRESPMYVLGSGFGWTVE